MNSRFDHHASATAPREGDKQTSETDRQLIRIANNMDCLQFIAVIYLILFMTLINSVSSLK